MQPYLKTVSFSPRLAPFVASIREWDIDGPTACTLSAKLLPNIAPLLVLQYGAPMWSERDSTHSRYHQVAAGIQTRAITIHPTGHIRGMCVRLKPETAPLIFAAGLHELRDAQVELGDFFSHSQTTALIEQLVEAPDTAQRVALVEEFLLSRIQARFVDPRMQQAAATLRRDFLLPVHRLAADLGLHERQLLRRFRATFGVSPKRFARIVRLTRVLELRRRWQRTWAQIASECGFADQAHLIRDFHGLTRHAPETLFRMAASEAVRPINSILGNSAFCNSFIVS